MALIPKFHVVAAERNVATGQSINMGQVVSLNSSGEVVIQNVTNPIPYGLAGDTKSVTASAMPGIATNWQNRASDMFDETKASGKMTVYHSGGEFATDQFDANVAGTSTLLCDLFACNGLLSTSNVQSTVVVARLLQLDAVYPSGVPGIDTAYPQQGDMALSGSAVGGTANMYIEVKLLI